jgi:hypothetical protein
LWKKALKRDEAELLTWDWDRQPDARAWHGRWTQIYQQELCSWISTAPLKPTTKRNYFNALHVTYDTRPELQETTGSIISELSKQINHSEGRQAFDDKENEHWLSHDYLTTVVESMHAQVKELLAYKQCRKMTPQEAFGETQGWQKLFDWLALTSMVHQPPLRGDWGDMYMSWDSWEAGSWEAESNTIHMQDPKQVRITIVKDKTIEHLGIGNIAVVDKMQYAINISNILWPRKYVFPAKNDVLAPLGVLNMTNYLRGMKHPETQHCLKQGVQLLRSSYITWAYGLGLNMNDKRSLAASMRHSWQTAEQHYNKVKSTQEEEYGKFLDDILA